MNPARSRFLLVEDACVALVVAGIVVYRTAHAVSFSWFSYSPRPGGFSISSGPGLSTRQLTGLILAVLGGIGGAAIGGYLLGRRNGTKRT